MGQPSFCSACGSELVSAVTLLTRDSFKMSSLLDCQILMQWTPVDSNTQGTRNVFEISDRVC